MEDDRIIVETGLEARVAAIVGPVAADIGLRLVRVRFSGLNGFTVQIMAEHPDGTMTINDCEALSRAVSPALDVEDVIDRTYHLEVSSPGIDRPLVRVSDFEAWRGHLAKVSTEQMVAGRRRFVGVIAGLSGRTLNLDAIKGDGGEPGMVDIPLATISEARLLLTDDLINESLKRDKALRKARGLPENDELEFEAEGDEAEAANDNEPDGN